MGLDTLLSRLRYDESPYFLKAGTDRLACAPDYGHVFRQAAEKPCNLQGVYTASPHPDVADAPLVPVVYICTAETEADADLVHRLVWNQDVAPFIMVMTRNGVRLYSGFRYCQSSPDRLARGVLTELTAFNELSELVAGFSADSINSGHVWRAWGHTIKPEHRVDWKLLDNLQKLDSWLQKRGDLDREVSHALIGKYVFLRYLSDRGILSARKLESWGIERSAIFGRDASREAFREVVVQLEDWLNGSIFPLPLSDRRAPTVEHIRRVAATFAGDEIVGDDQWQLHLDFQAYDFSYIPIETLSVVYQQFLHAGGTGTGSRARKAGAYYTPIPLVNFMLTEIDEHLPLMEGRRVCDPSCGSGAFLVQCFRRLIEREYPPTGPTRPTPTQLKELLTRHIFGVDRDSDACSVTELSLTLTLLDYVELPDLEDNPRFQLPALRGANVLCADFFDPSADGLALFRQRKFNWIVGNPPWKRLSSGEIEEQDEKTWQWITTAGLDEQTPVCGNQVAQAFVWELQRYLKADGEVALLLPAMTLFEHLSESFRAAFFSRTRVRTVANFSNLAEVLFAGRSRVPAAAFFFTGKRDEESEEEQFVRTYSPLVANQEPTRPVSSGTRTQTWSIVVNASEIRDLPMETVTDGSGLAWKLATWGSRRDQRLLRKLAKRFDSLGTAEANGLFLIAQGPDLRDELIPEGDAKTEFIGEVVGKRILDVNQLAEKRYIYSFPQPALVKNMKHYLHLRGGKKKLKVCPAPHVIVSAARSFAVYWDEYLIVPGYQIGIISPSNDEALLKALSLFLSSDFAFYHQFLSAPEFGVKRDRATLRVLRQIPFPTGLTTERELRPWVELHRRLAATDPRPLHSPKLTGPTLFDDDYDDTQEELLEELNELVYEALGISSRERALVHDLIHVRFALNDGKLGRAAVDPPDANVMLRYCQRLKSELDGFIGRDSKHRHDVGAVYDSSSGMVQVELVLKKGEANPVSIGKADSETVAQLARARKKLLKSHCQWVYFNRNLRVYEGRKTYVLKPMQRFHWTEGQAMADATEIVAETLASGESSV